MTPTERVKHLERAFLNVIASLESEEKTAAIMGDVLASRKALSLSTYMREILEIGADA